MDVLRRPRSAVAKYQLQCTLDHVYTAANMALSLSTGTSVNAVSERIEASDV